MTTCEHPIDERAALDWLQGELSDDETARLEEHLFGCPACTEAVAAWERLGRDVAAAARAGAVPVAVSGDLLDRARADGMALRTYRMGPGDAIRCTVAPGDEAVIVRIAVDADPGATVDLAADVSVLDTGERFTQMTEDLVVDRARGEVAYLFPGAYVRDLPRSRWDLTARVHGGAGEPLATCTMLHTPWGELSEAERRDA